MRSFLKHLALAATVALLSALPPGQAAQTRPLVLDNVRVIDGTGAAPVERGRVVVEGDRIVAIGPPGEVPIPANAETLDLSGRTLIPGLIDLHFHIENDPKLALRQLSHGITSFRDPGQWNEKFEGLRKLMAADGLPGPRIFTTGPHIDGERPAYPADSVVARDPVEARRLAERAVDGGATALKIYFRLPLASAKAVIEVCDARRVPCTAHLELLDAGELIASGLQGIEHITSFGMSLLPQVEAEAYRQSVLANNDARRDGRYALFAKANLDGPEAHALYRVLRERRPWIDPTLAVFERRRAEGPQPGKTSEQEALQVAGFGKMKELTRRAAQEGGRIVLGGHSTVPFAARGEAPLRELELLVESGFSPLEAITAATANAAAFLYRSDQIGTLRAGMFADLIVLRGDPRLDIAELRRPERVMTGGRWIDIERYRKY
jgi:imidazolonepropionase-like amidohydrolase